MRGKAPECRGKMPSNRITPACAGKRRKTGVFPRKTRDHPRVCGEKEMMNSENFQERGSPPRVRGKAVAIAAAISLCRITPACAGKSNKKD